MPVDLTSLAPADAASVTRTLSQWLSLDLISEILATPAHLLAKHLQSHPDAIPRLTGVWGQGNDGYTDPVAAVSPGSPPAPSPQATPHADSGSGSYTPGSFAQAISGILPLTIYVPAQELLDLISSGKPPSPASQARLEAAGFTQPKRPAAPKVKGSPKPQTPKVPKAPKAPKAPKVVGPKHPPGRPGTKPKLTPEQQQEAYAMLQSGTSVVEVARHFGTTRSVIYYLQRQLG